MFYDVNLKLFDDVNDSIFDLYNEKIDFVLFLNKNRATIFQKIIKKIKKNKTIWNVKIKKIQIWRYDINSNEKIKKKFELNWYNLYKIIRNKIFNIYLYCQTF